MNRQPISADAELRPIEPQHAAELFAVIDRNRAHLRPWLPWVEAVQAVEDEEAFIARSLNQKNTTGVFHCAIFHGEALAGGIGLPAIDLPNRKAEVGYWLDEAHQGKGLMTLACRAVVSYLFNEMKLHRVSIHCAVENRRSRAIPQRLGFRQEGVHRDAEWLNDHFVDLVCYAMLEPQWKGQLAQAAGPPESRQRLQK